MPARTPSKLSALFIGNSFTARNDLPGLIAKIAREAGRELAHQLISAGGASLRRHWNAGDARAAIESGKFNVVVLQEQSTMPIKNPRRMHENVRLFDEAIRAAGAKTALYLTWARARVPRSQRQITEAYESIGREIGAIVVPVGKAWESFLAKHDKPILHDKDGSHPTFAGSYLAACVFVRALFGKAALAKAGALGDLTAADAKALREGAITPA